MYKVRLFILLALCMSAAISCVQAQADSVGNYVWLDLDEDGLQDPSESGIAGVRLELYELLDTARFIAATVTDQNGFYRFDSLTRRRTYEIRLWLEQEAFSKWKLKPTLVRATTSQADSDGEDRYYPNYSVIRFNLTASSFHYDFGLVDVLFPNVRVNLCENALGAGASSFDLDRVRSELLDGRSGYEVSFYNSPFDLTNGVNEITNTIYSNQDQTIYALVSCTDPNQQNGVESMAEVELNYIDSMDYTELSEQVCPGEQVDLNELLRFYSPGYTPIDTVRVFSSADYDPATEINTSIGYVPTTYPDTLYFYATSNNNICYTDGQLVLTAKPSPELSLGTHERICPWDTVSLRILRAQYEHNGLCIESAWWSSVGGGGEFIKDSTALMADGYIPSEAQIAQEFVELIFHVIDEDCGREVRDTALVKIYPFGLFLRCSNDTISCRHPIANAATSITYNRPEALFDCEAFDIKLLYERERYFGCDTPFVKYIYRSWELSNKGQTIICDDTLFVQSIVLDTIEWPDTLVTFRCESSFSKIRGTNRPTAARAGVPKAGGVSLYPSADLCGWTVDFSDEEFNKDCTDKVGMIKRRWELKNNCTGAYESFVQTIEITNSRGPIPIIESLAHIDRERNTYTVELNVTHNCEAEIDPIVRVNPICSGLKQVDYRIEETGERGQLVPVENRANRWRFDPLPQTPYREGGYTMLIYATDSCWNQDSTAYQFLMSDRTSPLILKDSMKHVTIHGEINFFGIETFVKAAEDLCRIDYKLTKRDDWMQKLGLDRCPNFMDSIEYVIHLYNRDFLADFLAILPDDELGRKYGRFIRWLAEDERPSAQLIYKALKYELQSYWLEACARDEHGHSRFDATALDFFYDDETRQFDDLRQIGGGWMPDFYLCCSDVCDTVTISCMAVDAWANVALNWAEAVVHHHSRFSIKEQLDDISMSCQALEKHNILQLIDDHNYDKLDSILGRYQIGGGEADFTFTDYYCGRRDTTYRERYYDHDNMEQWRNVAGEIFSLDSYDRTYKQGWLDANCRELSIEQRFWVDIDACGVGQIIREFYLHDACTHYDHSSTLIDKQYIQVSNYPSCELDKDMFVFPNNTLIVAPFEYNDDGTVSTPFQITFVRPLFFERCNPFAVHYEDYVYPTDRPTRFRIERTWTVQDECTDSVLVHQQTLMFENTGPNLQVANDTMLTSAEPNPIAITVSPNPAIDQTTIQLRADQADEAVLRFYNQYGLLLGQRELTLRKGINSFTLKADELKNSLGTVWIHLYTQSGQSSSVTTLWH